MTVKASLIVIGTELTRGIIQDRHTALVSRELSSMGIIFASSTIIPDDGSIRTVLSSLMEKNDIVLVTGGLGPTTDDMTRSAIAGAAKRPLVRDTEAWEHLLATLGERAYGANEKQAYIPSGFTVIPNPRGTAPGFYGDADGTLIVSMPGPPREMEYMFHTHVLPLLRRRFGTGEEEKDEYSTFLISEAKLDELTEEVDPSLEWGTRFQDYRISLYVSGKSREERKAAVERLREKAGRERIAEGDVTPLSILVDTLREKGATLSCAESCTGGVASSLLTSLPGSSAYMLGSVTSYALSVKESVLGVRKETLDSYGAVSEECALEMAEGVRRLTGSTYSFSITGVAGPDRSEGKDVGTVSIGLSGSGRESIAITIRFFSYGRDSIRRRSTTAALLLLSAFIRGDDVRKILSSWTFF